MARGAALLLFLALVSAIAQAETIEGTVVAIADGDTLTLLVAKKQQVRIRLAEIDTPERGQPYANRSREALSQLVFRKHVRAEVQDTDRYGRTVARIYVGDLDVCAELVRRGAAWVYLKYAKDPALFDVEREARESRRGLWALPESQRVPPWEWRHPDAGGDLPRPALQTPREFSCEGKEYCREMTSCAEARFYLEHCGLARLDGDGDGVPCADICR